MDPVTEQTIEHLERLADLPLTPERRAAIAPQLRALVEAANELSRKMSAPHLRALTPSVSFVHPQAGEEQSS
jgi:hypothetical protein